MFGGAGEPLGLRVEWAGRIWKRTCLAGRATATAASVSTGCVAEVQYFLAYFLQGIGVVLQVLVSVGRARNSACKVWKGIASFRNLHALKGKLVMRAVTMFVLGSVLCAVISCSRDSYTYIYNYPSAAGNSGTTNDGSNDAGASADGTDGGSSNAGATNAGARAGGSNHAGATSSGAADGGSDNAGATNAGATDGGLDDAGGPSSMPLAIGCAITSPNKDAPLSEGVAVTIVVTTTRPAKVVIKRGVTVLGPAIMSGLTGTLTWTPTADDAGPQTINATATASSDGAVGDAPGVVVNVFTAAFPAGIKPLLRFDPFQTAYSDLAKTTIANVDDRVRAIPQPPPLSGAWTAPSDIERPTRYAAGTLSLSPLSADFPAHRGQWLRAPSPAASIPPNNSTIAMCYRPLLLEQGGLQGLVRSPEYGIGSTGNGINVYYNGGQTWNTGLLIGTYGPSVDQDDRAGGLVCVVVRYTPSGIDVYLDFEGEVQTSSMTATITSGTVGAIAMGTDNLGVANALVGQLAVIGSAVSDADRLTLVSWMKTRGVAEAFPVTRRFVGCMGDSIVAGWATYVPLMWTNRMTDALRATYPDVQVMNVGIPGAGIIPASGPFSGQYATVSDHLSMLRARSVVILSTGTNELVSDPSDDYVDDRLEILYETAADARARGAKVAIATILDRSQLSSKVTQAQFNHARARWNANLRTNVGTRFDAIIDQDTVTAMLDSTNTTNYVDGIHPTSVGHGLLAPVFTAAVLPLLK